MIDAIQMKFFGIRNAELLGKSEAEIALKAEADTLPEIIRGLKKPDERWLIFVDQFEELFTSCHDLDKRNNFIESLVRVANSKDSSVKIVLAMRADFLEQLSSYPDLGAIVNQNNLHLVTDMHPDELRQAIEQPAALPLTVRTIGAFVSFNLARKALPPRWNSERGWMSPRLSIIFPINYSIISC